MVVAEWIVWVISCIVLLSFFLAALTQRDFGIRSHHMRHCLLLAPGLLITIITPISKFHLLWWVPVTFFLNLLLSNILLSLRLKRGMRNFEKQQFGERTKMRELSTIKVLLVDDHKAVRDELRKRFMNTDDIIVVGEAADGMEALHQVESFSPDIVLTNIKMPVMDGLDAAKIISEEKIAPVVLLTAYSQRQRG